MTIKTKITELFNIDLPIILPGMTQISNPDLVAAVSNAGGLGLLASVTLTTEEFHAAIKQVKALTSKPFGVGIPLLTPDAAEKVHIAIQEQVPVVNFALGKGAWIVEQVHAYGGKVIATVTNERHARAAVDAGTDALMVTGLEAAGHGSTLSSMILLSHLRRIFEVPIIAAGGFSTGASLVAGLALGADAVAMGTRFSIALESPMHKTSKQAVLNRSVNETLYTDRYDGMDCRIMQTSAADKLIQTPTNYYTAFRAAQRMAKSSSRSPWKLYIKVISKGPAYTLKLARMASAGEAMIKAVKEGDHVSGIQPVGQAQGLIDDTASAAEIINTIMAEAKNISTNVHNTLGGQNQTTKDQKNTASA
ncbi:MAG: nitronate monooxygenase [Pseudomonadales bacterium]|nr:nitronate monooxygenase [Pseudomonadales bacterium]